MKKLEKIKQTCIEMLDELDDLQKKIEKSLRRAPEGTLNLSTANGSSQYYHKIQRHEKKGKYIEKGNSKLIKALAQKDYDLRMLKEVEVRKKNLQKIRMNFPEKCLDEIYSSLPLARKQFVKPYVVPDDEYVKEWSEVEYEGNPYLTKFAVYTTERGEQVRSKSEKIIADKLYAMGMPYRYEYPLLFYFEHFGMMDDPEYSGKAVLKLQTYARNHIYPGKQLLMSFETSKTPLDISYIEKMLNEFILD